jgi:hypothetical protein
VGIFFLTLPQLALMSTNRGVAMNDLENAAIANDPDLLRYLEDTGVPLSEYNRLRAEEKAHILRAATVVPTAGNDDLRIDCILRVGTSILIIVFMFAVAFVQQLRDFLLGELGYAKNEGTSDFVSYMLSTTAFLITCISSDLLVTFLGDSAIDSPIRPIHRPYLGKAALITILVIASLMATQLRALALLLTALSLVAFWTIGALLQCQSVRIVLCSVLHP